MASAAAQLAAAGITISNREIKENVREKYGEAKDEITKASPRHLTTTTTTNLLKFLVTLCEFRNDNNLNLKGNPQMTMEVAFKRIQELKGMCMSRPNPDGTSEALSGRELRALKLVSKDDVHNHLDDAINRFIDIHFQIGQSSAHIPSALAALHKSKTLVNDTISNPHMTHVETAIACRQLRKSIEASKLAIADFHVGMMENEFTLGICEGQDKSLEFWIEQHDFMMLEAKKASARWERKKDEEETTCILGARERREDRVKEWAERRKELEARRVGRLE